MLLNACVIEGHTHIHIHSGEIYFWFWVGDDHDRDDDNIVYRRTRHAQGVSFRHLEPDRKKSESTHTHGRNSVGKHVIKLYNLLSVVVCRNCL